MTLLSKSNDMCLCHFYDNPPLFKRDCSQSASRLHLVVYG